MARAVGKGSMLGAGTGAIAGSFFSDTETKQSRGASPQRARRENTSSSMGQRAGSALGAVLDTKNRFKDKASAVKENIKDMPTQTAYAVHSAKEKAKSSVSDFKRGIVQEQQSRQTGRMEKQEQHRQNIADKRMQLQKAQEAKQSGRKADGSATAGATRVHDRPVTASSANKNQTTPEKRERPVVSGKMHTQNITAQPVKRPLSSSTDRKNPAPTIQKASRSPVQTSQQTRTVQQTGVAKNSNQKQQTTKQIQKTKKGRKP